MIDLQKSDYSVEARLTTDLIADVKGAHLFFPYGLIWQHRNEWDAFQLHVTGPYGFHLKFGTLRDNWSEMIDLSGQPVMKFLFKPIISDDYQVFECHSYGKWYKLEARITEVYE